MSGKGPRQKWISKSANPKEADRKFSGAQPQKLGDRNGRATHRNTQDGICVTCNTHVEAETGWLLILPRGNGQNRTPFATMCRPCATPKVPT